MRAIYAFQITLKDEKMIEMDRHIKTISGQLSDLQTRLSSAEELSSTLRGELDIAKDEIRSRVTSEASFASMEAALRAKSAQVSTMESLVRAREGQVDAMKRLVAAASDSQQPNSAMDDAVRVRVHHASQDQWRTPATERENQHQVLVLDEENRNCLSIMILITTLILIMNRLHQELKGSEDGRMRTTRSAKIEEWADLRQRDAEAAAVPSPSGVVEGRSFADTLRN